MKQKIMRAINQVLDWVIQLLVAALKLLGKGIAWVLLRLWLLLPKRLRDRLAAVHFHAWLALGFSAVSWLHPLWMAAFWALVFLFVELGYWEEYRQKAKGWLLMGGQPKVADEWDKFSAPKPK